MTDKEFLSKARFETFDFEGRTFSVRVLLAEESADASALSEKLSKELTPDKALSAVNIAYLLGDSDGARIFSDADAKEALRVPVPIQNKIVVISNKLNPRPTIENINAEKKS